MDVYKRPGGVLVVDFTPAPKQVLELLGVRLKRCPQCGNVCDGAIPEGRHAPHGDDAGHIVNCVGETMGVWP